MQIISPELDLVSKILGKQALKESAEYRMITYCQTHKVEEGTLIYNLLTKEMILLDEKEAVNFNNVPNLSEELLEYLVSHWFFVPQDSNDRKLYNQVKTMILALNKKSKNLTRYTILTTTDCNARCFYCYELGRSRIPMSEQTALDVAQFIKDNCGGNNIKIGWFGGEPLYNCNVIDIITDSLAESGINYVSSMISNGYLFNEEIAQRASQKWNLRDIQITLDGTEEIYNKSKAFIYKEGSAFERVTNNIELLLQQGISVKVRMNMDKHNAEDLFELTDYLASRFGKYPKFHVYAALLYESTVSRTDEERHEIYKKYLELNDYLDEKGIASKYGVPRTFRINQCMADEDNATLIAPDGSLGKCEHYTDSDFWGSIYSDKRDEEIIASWKKKCPEIEECKTCRFYPQCYVLEKCEESSKGCFEEMRTLREQRLKKAMRNTYNVFKNKSK